MLLKIGFHFLLPEVSILYVVLFQIQQKKMEAIFVRDSVEPDSLSVSNWQRFQNISVKQRI